MTMNSPSEQNKKIKERLLFNIEKSADPFMVLTVYSVMPIYPQDCFSFQTISFHIEYQ